MKKVAIFLIPFLLSASNFSDGVRAFKAKNYETAKKYFESALTQDNSINANYFLGIIYLNGLGTEKNLNKAETYLKKAINSGNVRANCYLAEVYISKYNDINQAKKLLKSGIKQGARECANIAQKYNINL